MKMNTQWRREGRDTCLFDGGTLVAVIPGLDGCEDRMEELEEGAWRWTRHSEVPVDSMEMELCQQESVAYWMVPSGQTRRTVPARRCSGSL